MLRSVRTCGLIVAGTKVTCSWFSACCTTIATRCKTGRASMSWYPKVRTHSAEAPERSWRGPRAPRERPRSRQEAPQNRSKRAFAAGEPQERPGETQEPPQRAPGSDFGASRASFGSFLGAPGTSFLSSSGAVQGRCACSHYVPQMLGRRVPR